MQAQERFSREQSPSMGSSSTSRPWIRSSTPARLIAEVGPIDVLVNNAGVVFGGPFLDVDLDRHLATIAVNLSGVITLTHAFLPDLIARPVGHIVNIASAAAVIALPMATSYAASKWAVLGFSDSLREELASPAIVTSASPRFVPATSRRDSLRAQTRPVDVLVHARGGRHCHRSRRSARPGIRDAPPLDPHHVSSLPRLAAELDPRYLPALGFPQHGRMEGSPAARKRWSDAGTGDTIALK